MKKKGKNKERIYKNMAYWQKQNENEEERTKVRTDNFLKKRNKERTWELVAKRKKKRERNKVKQKQKLIYIEVDIRAKTLNLEFWFWSQFSLVIKIGATKSSRFSRDLTKQADIFV